MTTVLHASPYQFVDTPSIQRLVLRALRYLRSGYAVHLRGPAGTGKTTLAIHLANLLARPIVVVFGDDEVKSSDLVGTQSGFTRKKVVDNFIHSVIKVEDELQQAWVDARLTLACKEGLTLVYDEFNRSRPEGNNVLLSVLEEKLLVLPPHRHRQEYIRVHPEFRAIFTSNPEEYCGVHAAQNALLDRMITINVPEPDVFTQTEILMRKTAISQADAATIVQLVGAFRDQTQAEKTSGLRSALMLATICCDHHIRVAPNNEDFQELCQDVLLSRSSLMMDDGMQVLQTLFAQLEFYDESRYQPESVNTLQQFADNFTNCSTRNVNPSETYSVSSVFYSLNSINNQANEFEIDLETLEVEETKQVENTVKSNELKSLEPQIAIDRHIINYLQETEGARLLEIEQDLELSRIELIAALKTLLREKKVIQHDRIYKLVEPKLVEPSID
ncbi:gas vesicle protein GvpN [Thermocoleostomius sinensis]|uniref:Gas vesicle protein GvpN n=1 Tax=Thermocoleostomius sinensis A174 TaxID=2016057 RepID=A0A9E8ZHS0_9CYAN|nr:gas vesicle protein GvpN [Thermocoleostomius sinensis]WAL61523.1 gas vesicle protein GvpN [Thermocoleostomius sinensis A174]